MMQFLQQFHVSFFPSSPHNKTKIGLSNFWFYIEYIKLTCLSIVSKINLKPSFVI